MGIKSFGVMFERKEVQCIYCSQLLSVKSAVKGKSKSISVECNRCGRSQLTIVRVPDLIPHLPNFVAERY